MILSPSSTCSMLDVSRLMVYADPKDRLTDFREGNASSIMYIKGKEWKLHKETASAPFMKRGQASPLSLTESKMCFGVRENF